MDLEEYVFKLLSQTYDGSMQFPGRSIQRTLKLKLFYIHKKKQYKSTYSMLFTESYKL